MNTKLLMTSSAISLALIGLGLTFLASEIAVYLLPHSTILFPIMLQVLGALFFALALLNWMTKGNTMGGIYNRPIVMANFAHYLMSGLALIKGVINYPDLPLAISIIGGVFLLFASLFASVLFSSPVKKQELRTVN